MIYIGHQVRSSVVVTFPLIWFYFLMWMITLTQPEDVGCCPKGTKWTSSINCSDGNLIRLNCPFGLYKLEPETQEYDNFTIDETENGTWLIHDGQRVSPDRYCLVDIMDGNMQTVLKCFEEEAIDEPAEWKNALFCVLNMVSAIFLIITLAVYAILPELRDIQDKALMAAVASLAISYIVLFIQHVRQQEEGDNIICTSLGFLLYYVFMATFFWLNIVAFNIWRSVWFKNFIVKGKSLFTIYCTIGWGAPTCFLAATLVTDYTEGNHLKPHFGEHNCFLSGIIEMWVYFYGPVAVLLALNVIYLSLTSWQLWHEYREYNGNRLRALRFKCLLYFKLILVMGITWIFEVLSFAAGTKNNEYWIPTDILNALQGFVIFLLLVAMRKRVRKLLAKKRPCGLSFPKSWIAYDDEECEAVLPEEVELYC